MYTLSDRSQFQAQAIKQGRHKLAIAHQEIIDRITKEFNVHALDFSCEARETSKGARQQLIHLILESAEDVKRMQANRDGIAAITEQFLNYLKSLESSNFLIDPLKSNVFPVETNPFPEIIITFRPLKEVNNEVIKEMRDDEKLAILKTFESVWTISQNVVFYYTDEQIKENWNLGTTTKIIDELGRVDKKYEFDGGSEYRFESKESFDRDFGGNWYYFWK